MQPDAEGFLYPVIDQSLCIDCGLCEKVCPVLHRNEAPDPASLPVYACRNTNETIRMASSSGGVFTLLAEQVIARGGVVFGARFDSDFMVVHDSAETLGKGWLRCEDQNIPKAGLETRSVGLWRCLNRIER